MKYMVGLCSKTALHFSSLFRNASSACLRSVMSFVVTRNATGVPDSSRSTAHEAVGRVAHELLHTRFPEPFADITAEILHTGSWQGELVHTTRDAKRAV